MVFFLLYGYVLFGMVQSEYHLVHTKYLIEQRQNQLQFKSGQHLSVYILPKFNIAPENRPSQK